MGNFQEEQKILIFCCCVSGLYMPSVKKLTERKWIIRILQFNPIIPILGNGALLLSYVKNLFFDEGEFVVKSFTVGLMVNYFLTTYKILYFNLNSRKFEKIFKLWDNSFKEDLFSAERKELLEATRKRTDRYIKVVCGSGFFATLLYTIPPYFNPEKKLTHPTGFEYRNQSPDYECVVTFELIVGLYTGILGSCFDAIFMVLLSLEKEQLAHLQNSLAEIVDTVQVEGDGEMLISKNGRLYPERTEKIFDGIEVEEKRRIILIWVLHHQQLFKFHDEIRKIYHQPLCIIFGVIVVTVCLLAFLNIVGGLTALETVVSLIFFTGQYSLFYFTCRFGDNISDISSNIFQKAFSKAWYVYPKPLKTIFHIILMRCQRPLEIVAFDIYPLGARSFYKIFKTAYTFFTMLIQLQKKKDFMAKKQLII